MVNQTRDEKAMTDRLCLAVCIVAVSVSLAIAAVNLNKAQGLAGLDEARSVASVQSMQ